MRMDPHPPDIKVRKAQTFPGPCVMGAAVDFHATENFSTLLTHSPPSFRSVKGTAKAAVFPVLFGVVRFSAAVMAECWDRS